MSNFLDYTGLQYYHGKVQGEISQLGLKLGPTSISPTGNGYVNTNVGEGNVVNLTPASTSSDWRYYIAEVSAGDLVTVSGRGGNGSRLWAFIDADNKLLTVSAGGATSTGLVLTAPTNAAKVVVNNNVSLYGTGSVIVEKSDSFPHVLSQTVDDAAFDTLLEVGPITAQPTGNGYVNTNVGVGEVVNLTPASSSSDWRYYIAKVKAGVSVIISGRGGSNSRLWAFLDSEGKLLSISASGAVAKSLKLTAPANAAKIVVNNNVALYGPGSVVVEQDGSMIDELIETLPTTKTINVLIIGNSYSYRSTAQNNASLLELCRKAGVRGYVEIVGNGGASFDTLWESYENNSGCGYHWYGDESSGWTTAGGDGITIKTVLTKKNWDYIFFHQSSALSGNYSSFSPSLAKLIKAAKTDCTNEQCKIGLMLTWAYANNTGTYPNATTGFATQADFYAAICSAYEQAVEDYKVDVLVPAGTAIQNARATSLGTDFDDFASSADDASHINPAGGAIAAMAWFASIWGRINRIPLNTIPQFSPLFTTAQFALALTSAKNAIQFPFEVTEIS